MTDSTNEWIDWRLVDLSFINMIIEDHDKKRAEKEGKQPE